MDIFGKFYSPQKLLSYNRPYCFTLGSRSIGKSTGWALWCLLEFIKHKREFVYCRRTKDELMETCRNYFDNAINILQANGYNIESFEYKGGEYFLNGEKCGYTIPLSLEQKYKSANYGKVFYLIYDEFLPRNGRFLGGRGSSQEVDAMQSLFQTIDRDVGTPHRDELRVIFIGNFSHLYNPFFVTYGIDKYVRSDSKYIAPKGEIWALELTRETEATRDIESSNSWKVSTGKNRAYAFENQNYDNSGAFIEKIKGKKFPILELHWDGDDYTFYTVPEQGLIYMEPGGGSCALRIVGTTADHRPNYLLVEQSRSFTPTKTVRECYERGLVRFKNGKCKNALDNYMAFMI